MDRSKLSAVLFQEGNCWIAQGLEYDITAQGSSPPDALQKLYVKLVTEVAISLDLKIEPLEGIERAPQEFWQMYEEAKMTVDWEPPPVRISDGGLPPNIVPRAKIGQLAAA